MILLITKQNLITKETKKNYKHDRGSIYRNLSEDEKVPKAKL